MRTTLFLEEQCGEKQAALTMWVLLDQCCLDVKTENASNMPRKLRGKGGEVGKNRGISRAALGVVAARWWCGTEH